MDCWWAQFLTPAAEKSKNSDLIQSDLDSAFDRMPAAEVYDKLINHFKRPKELIKPDGRICQKLDRNYEFGAAPTWQPNHLDGEYSLFGYLLRDYVTGKLDVDIDRVKEQIRFSGQVPDAVIQNTMQRWFEAASTKSPTGEAMVHLPAADPPYVSRADFERLFTAKLRQSVDGFAKLLDEAQRAREDREHPMRKFYENMPARVF